MNMRALALLLSIAMFSPEALAGGLALRFGPPSVGIGGPNPLSIPPSGADAQLQYTTTKGFESNLSVTGLLFGYRATAKWGGYVTLGGGLALNARGGGPAIYSSFGADFWCGWVCMTAEYQRALGANGAGVMQPYAFRLGVSLWFK